MPFLSARITPMCSPSWNNTPQEERYRRTRLRPAPVRSMARAGCRQHNFTPPASWYVPAHAQAHSVRTRATMLLCESSVEESEKGPNRHLTTRHCLGAQLFSSCLKLFWRTTVSASALWAVQDPSKWNSLHLSLPKHIYPTFACSCSASVAASLEALPRASASLVSLRDCTSASTCSGAAQDGHTVLEQTVMHGMC